MKTILLLLVLFVSCFASNTVAVFNFSGRGLSNDEALTITDRFSLELSQTKSFEVVDRNNVKALMDEQSLSQTGMVDESTAIEIGKLLAAHHIIFGSVSKFGTMYTINVKMINVETGKIVKSESADCTGDLNLLLLTTVRNAAFALAGKEIPQVSGKKTKKRRRRKDK